MNIRKQLLTGHFHEEVLEEILKASSTLTTDQFCSFYKFLMAEKSSVTEIYKKALQEESQNTQSIDHTRAILEAKYGKK